MTGNMGKTDHPRNTMEKRRPNKTTQNNAASSKQRKERIKAKKIQTFKMKKEANLAIRDKNVVVREYLKQKKKAEKQQRKNQFNNQAKAEATEQTDVDSSGKNLNKKKKQTDFVKGEKSSVFFKAEKSWRTKLREKEQALEIAQAKSEALKKYIKEKKAKHKKIAKRNYKGQPNMASQIELLLDKIQAPKKN